MYKKGLKLAALVRTLIQMGNRKTSLHAVAKEGHLDAVVLKDKGIDADIPIDIDKPSPISRLALSIGPNSVGFS
jgi:hypothetical protein